MMSLKKIRVLFVCLTGLFLGMPTAAVAGADSGFYLGLGIGDANVQDSGTDPSGGDYNFDESDSAYKVFGGYNFGVIPLVDVAIEASYADFGNPSAGVQKAEVTGFSVFGLAGLSFGPFGIFAKAGVVDWDADTSDGTVSNSESGTDPAYGIGARFALGSFAVRAEYEIYDLDSDLEVGMASVSGVYTF
jgi:outer membrane immunogenic protein